MAYGPTVCWLITVTPPPPELLPLPLAPAFVAPAWGAQEHDAHCGRFGETMVGTVAASSAWKRTSALSPTFTVPWMGSTHANDCGFPEYWISS